MEPIYLTKEFAREARRAGLDDDGLFEAVDRAEAGQVDADLGGGVVKQRVARKDRGRSSGFRTIIAWRKGRRAIFLHMFAKSRQASLSQVELETYRDLAKQLDRLTRHELDALVSFRGWRRIERKRA